jgi:outer membrane protein
MKRLAAALLPAVVLTADLARADNLLDVFTDALANDPQIREANANRMAARESRPQAIAAFLPQADASGAIERDKINGLVERPQQIGDSIVLFHSEGTQQPDTKSWTVSLRQSVFSWANWVALRRANHTVAQAEADYQAVQQELIARTAQRYFAVLQARNTVEADLAAEEAFGRAFDQASERYEAGLIAITDKQEAQAARDAAAADVIQAKRDLASAEESLREVTDKQYGALARPGEDMPLAAPAPADAEQWVNQSMEQNLALISSRLAADIARDDVHSAISGHLPTLDLLASKSHSDQDSTQSFAPNPPGQPTTVVVPYTNVTNQETYRLQLTVPIFSGGAAQSRVRQTQYQWIAAKGRVSRVSRETERLARDAYLGVISGIARVQALRQALASSQTALEATQAGYEVGTRTQVEVLSARRALVQAQTNYANSRFDYINSIVKLRLAAGTLDRQTLAEVNGWLSESEPAAPQPLASGASARPRPNG